MASLSSESSIGDGDLVTVGTTLMEKAESTWGTAETSDDKNDKEVGAGGLSIYFFN